MTIRLEPYYLFWRLILSNKIPKVENLITDPDLCELFGCKTKQLARLRNEARLPFLKISRTRRLYLESDVIEWLLSRRKVLNTSESDEQ